MGEVDDVVLRQEGFVDTPWYAFQNFIKYTRTILKDSWLTMSRLMD